MGLTAPIVTVFGTQVSGRDLVLLIGGAFLIWKSVHEIHTKLEGVRHRRKFVATMAFSAPISMGSAVAVEMLDLRMRRGTPVALKGERAQEL